MFLSLLILGGAESRPRTDTLYEGISLDERVSMCSFDYRHSGGLNSNSQHVTPTPMLPLKQTPLLTVLHAVPRLVRLKPFFGQHVRNIQIQRHGIKRLLHPHPLPHRPPHPIRPIDQVQMANPHQRPSILSPLTTPHAHQTIVITLLLPHNTPRPSERTECGRGLFHSGAEGVVLYIRGVWRGRVELVGHVAGRELRERGGRQPSAAEKSV